MQASWLRSMQRGIGARTVGLALGATVMLCFTVAAPAGPVIGPGCECECDVNGDGACDFADGQALLACFGGPPMPGCREIICDGIIDQKDIDAWQCFFEGGDGDACCKGVEAKWSQRPHPPQQGFNVPSNVDFRDLVPNVVVADDFRSDGRPITCVRWWGSYPDPAFEPGGGGCSCDLDGDGACTFADLQQLLACIGSPPSAACPDLDCDGEIGESDIAVWKCLASGGPPDVCCPECSQRRIDTWALSFHTDAEVVVDPPTRRPGALLGLYTCDNTVVQRTPTPIVGWDGHRVYEYVVELGDCCLEHTFPDPRTNSLPANASCFGETDGLLYWLDVEAIVGARFLRQPVTCPTCDCDLDGNGECDFNDLLQILQDIGTPFSDINCDGFTNEADIEVWNCLVNGTDPAQCCASAVCEQIDTNNNADEDFWGWHTSPDAFGGASVNGRLGMTPDGVWVYGDWVPVDGTPHELDRVDQAFELLTPICLADIDGDNMVGFSDLLLVLAGWGPCATFLPCPADLNCDGIIGFDDLLLVLGAWGPCP